MDRTRRAGRSSRNVILACLTVVALVGCGGDEDGGADTGTPPDGTPADADTAVPPADVGDAGDDDTSVPPLDVRPPDGDGGPRGAPGRRVDRRA